jgi:hypothetical protein
VQEQVPSTGETGDPCGVLELTRFR